MNECISLTECFFIENKKVPDNRISIVKDGKSTLYRGATLICGIHTLIRILTYSWQLTYAFTSWNTQSLTDFFDHALSGPFNKLHSAGSQQSQLSVSALFIFISTSTVSFQFLLNCFYYTPQIWFVKRRFEIMKQMRVEIMKQMMIRRCWLNVGSNVRAIVHSVTWHLI